MSRNTEGNFTDTNMMPDLLANPIKVISEARRWNPGEPLDEDIEQYTKQDDGNNNKNEKETGPFARDTEKKEEPRQQQSRMTEDGTDFKSAATKDPNDESSWTQEELMIKKLEMLRKLLELHKGGTQLTQNYNMNSDYKLMKMEYELHKGIRSKHNTVTWMSNMMINAVQGLEFLNDTYDPFGLELKGWSEQISTNVNNYYDVFGELYEKYNKPGKSVAPEIKLFFMLSGSALQFHMANKFLKGNLGGMNNSIEQNPELAEELRRKAALNKIKQETQRQNEVFKNKLNEKQTDANKMIEKHVEELNYIRQKEMEKNKMEQDAQKLQQLKQSLNITQMPPRPVNTNTMQATPAPVNNTPIVQPTMQIPPSVQKMMEQSEKQKQEVLKKQAEMIDTQKKAAEIQIKTEYINQLERAKKLKDLETRSNRDNASMSSRTSNSSKMSINKDLKNIILSARNEKNKNDSDSDIQITPVGLVDQDEVSKSHGSSKKSNTSNNTSKSKKGKKISGINITI
jgi:hypothetical protein